MASEAIRSADRALIGDVWTSDEAWDHCAALVERFPRRYGSHPDEAGARDYLVETLRRYGIKARVESFPCTHWTPGPAVLEVTAPEDTWPVGTGRGAMRTLIRSGRG